jgi:hypothetical protein
MLRCQYFFGGQKPLGFCHCLIEVIPYAITPPSNFSPITKKPPLTYSTL